MSLIITKNGTLTGIIGSPGKPVFDRLLEADLAVSAPWSGFRSARLRRTNHETRYEINPETSELVVVQRFVFTARAIT
jgi:hypothetical protein